MSYTSIITFKSSKKMADDIMSDEDKALFRDHMRSVQPLKEKTKRAQPAAPKPSTRPKHMARGSSTRSPNPSLPIDPTNKSRSGAGDRRTPEKKEYFLSDSIIDTVLSETILSYAHPSLPNQRFKALRHGKIPWETRLDLHGLKSEKACDTLCQFIQNQAQNDKRCLLIIHGKGGHQEGSPPVIKNLLNRWLPQLDEVLAFHSALPKDGGSGAVYVLLKRTR